MGTVGWACVGRLARLVGCGVVWCGGDVGRHVARGGAGRGGASEWVAGAGAEAGQGRGGGGHLQQTFPRSGHCRTRAHCRARAAAAHAALSKRLTHAHERAVLPLLWRTARSSRLLLRLLPRPVLIATAIAAAAAAIAAAITVALPRYPD